jgi:hypothetical protein
VLLKRRIHSSQVSQQNQEKVWKAATRVSLANILELGVDITLEEVEILRDWYYHFPQKFSGADLGLCNKLLQILYTFSHLPYLDRKQVRLIRGRWIGKILSALSIEDIPTKQLASMLGRMRPYDLFYLILYWQRKQKARGSTGQ